MDVPEFIDLDDILEREPGRHYYQLRSMVSHDSAETLDSGHYTACTRDSHQDAWHVCSDEDVVQTTACHAMQLAAKAYLLQYERCAR